MFNTPVVVVNFDFCFNEDNSSESQYCCPAAYCDILAGEGIYIIPALPTGRNEIGLKSLVSIADGFLFIGEGNYPASVDRVKPSSGPLPLGERRFVNDFALFNLAWLSSKPILGIGDGMQLAVLAQGGRLSKISGENSVHYSISGDKESVHSVQLEHSKLRSALGAKTGTIISPDGCR